MKYQIPKTFMGKPIKGSLERVLAGLDKTPISNPSVTNPPINNLKEYIYVPKSGIHIAKQRTHLGLNWYQTHEELQNQNLRMPTIPEFISFLNYLKTDYQDKQEAQIILDNILKIGDWRGEWLDARFEKNSGKLYINSNHRTDLNGNLQPQNQEPLEDYLREDSYADIFNPNSQGLPTSKLSNSYEQGKNAYFWYPRDTRVARFGALSVGALLCCGRDPQDTYSSLGVFSVCEANATQ